MIQFPFAPTGTNGGQLSFNNWAGDSVLHGMGAIKTYCTFGTPGNYSSNMDFYISRAGAYQLGMRLDSNSDLTVMGAVRSGGLIYPGNDATFYFSFNAGAPMLHFDSNNYMYFSRAVKSYNFIVNGTNPLIIKQQAVGINIEPVVAFHVNSQGPMIRWQCWAAGGNDFYQTWYNGDTRISYEGFVGTVAKQWVLENAGQFYWSTNGRNMVFNEVGHLNLGDSVSDFGAILNVSSNTNHIAWFNTYTNPPIPVVTQRADPGKVCLFLYNGATAGWIDIITTTTVGYQSTSDARLKTNIVPAAPAGSIIDAINIVEHDWIKGGHTAYGVIAQDLHPVFPDAVSVGNDELTLPRAAVEAKPEVKNKEGVITQHAEEGHPAYAGGDLAKPWGVDYSKMVPLLIKEIQELRARVAVLEAV
jgi:hypothetical protein